MNMSRWIITVITASEYLMYRYLDNLIVYHDWSVCTLRQPVTRPPLTALPPPECHTVGDISSASACAKDLQDGERSNAGRGCARTGHSRLPNSPLQICTMHTQCTSNAYVLHNIALYTIHVTRSVVRVASFYPSCFDAHDMAVCFEQHQKKPRFVSIIEARIDWYYFQSLR